MTYKQAFDRITEAYIKDELNPWDGCACFIGNLLGGLGWGYCRNARSSDEEIQSAFLFIKENGAGVYSVADITDMENNFLTIIDAGTFNDGHIFYPVSLFPSKFRESHPNYENALFLAMESTLGMLKQIHIRNGETIDAPVLTKRKLAKI